MVRRDQSEILRHQRQGRSEWRLSAPFIWNVQQRLWTMRRLSSGWNSDTRVQAGSWVLLIRQQSMGTLHAIKGQR